MKKLLKNPISQLTSSQMDTLTTIVKESVAFDATPITHHVFTTADLWNIQRNAKQRVQRRFL